MEGERMKKRPDILAQAAQAKLQRTAPPVTRDFGRQVISKVAQAQTPTERNAWGVCMTAFRPFAENAQCMITMKREGYALQRYFG